MDLRGIWDPTTGLDLEQALARGLDTADLQLPVRVVRSRGRFTEEVIPPKQGTITLDCILEIEGIARDCRRASGREDLFSAATATVSGWRWQPLRLDGVPRRAAVLFEISYPTESSRW